MTGPGELLGGRYRLDERLGSGGMAEVYRGRDLRLGRVVAIKILRSELADEAPFRQRFHREAKNSAALNHPGIVATHDFGDELDLCGTHVLFIVMELVDGRTLRDLLQAEGKLEIAQAVRIVVEMCSALEFSHQRDIIHRDIKPGNVMITSSGQVKVMDFGIALALSGTAITPPGAVVGTARYLSPEQANGSPVDARSDVYAIGCVLYELLCGQPPFVADNPVAVAYHHIQHQPQPPEQRRPGIPAALGAIVIRALAKQPADRQQSARQLGQELERFLAGFTTDADWGPPVGHDPVAVLTPPASAGTTQLSRAEVDQAFTALREKQQHLGQVLLDLDSHPGQVHLGRADFRGQTAVTAEALRVRATRLWSAYAVGTQVLDRAASLLPGRLARASQSRLAELSWLLRGGVVGSQPEDPHQRAEETAASGEATLEQLHVWARVEAVEVALGLEDLDSGIKGALREMDLLVRGVRRLEGQVAGYGGNHEDDLRGLRADLAGVRDLATADPLGAGGQLDLLVRRLRDSEEALGRLQLLRREVPERIEQLRQLAEEVVATEQAAAEAREVVRVKIASPGLGPRPDRGSGLLGRLAELSERMTGRPELAALDQQLTELEGQLVSALRQARTARVAATGLLERRDELRGRVEAYRAVAVRLGRGEDVELAERYQRARDLLWHAPSDLRAATVAVVRFQESIWRGEQPI